jgi:transcriptional regulator with XRE-family HTH domain
MEEQSDTLVGIGLRIRAVREQRGWNQDEFAHRARVHRSYVTQLENGRKDFRISTLYRLAEALAIPVTDLLTGGPDAAR